MEDLIIKPNDTDLVSALHNGVDLPLPFEQDIFLYGTEIAGTRYRENIAALYEMIQEGDMLTLIREPENPYDEYAIRIDVDDHGLALFCFLFKIRKILLRQVFHIPHVSPPFSMQNGSTRILT